jgi:hypothetical protein
MNLKCDFLVSILFFCFQIQLVPLHPGSKMCTAEECSMIDAAFFVCILTATVACFVFRAARHVHFLMENPLTEDQPEFANRRAQLAHYPHALLRAVGTWFVNCAMVGLVILLWQTSAVLGGAVQVEESS